MKFGSQIIAALAFAIVLAPAVRANDTAAPQPIAAATAAPATAASAVATAMAAPALAPNLAAESNDAGDSNTTLAAGASSAPATGLFTPMLATPARFGRAAAAGWAPGGSQPTWTDPNDDYPRWEWFVGYTFWQAVPVTARDRLDYMNGASSSLALNLDPHVGLVFDFGGYADSRLRLPLNGIGTTTLVKASGDVLTFMGGVRVSARHERLTPFGQVLFGTAQASAVTISKCTGSFSACRPLGEDTGYAAAIGGGMDLTLNRHVAWRIFQMEYLLTGFRNAASLTGMKSWEGNLRISTGLVFRTGGNPPPPPVSHAPEAACVADKSMVFVGSGDVVMVSANATDVDNNPLTYTWAANGGAIEGTGPQVHWNSTGSMAGTYNVRVRVDDGRGGTAACSADIQVAQRPDHPPTLSCSADRTTVSVGDLVQITATANSPDNDPLTYSWTSSGGRIRGAAESVQFDTGGLAPGNYTVSGSVDDGNGGTANCQLAIDVQEPPPPPEMVAIAARLSLHSIYFPTARPTPENPTGGLLPSQQNTLLALAADFTKYLTYKSDAHLILGGHADIRGSEEYNKALTERRVARTKSFLVEHGVPEADIDTQAFGKDDNLTAEQVKAQMDADPDLNPADRQEMLKNMTVMVLANNRRVDVSLSTTGQQSVQRYPFNTDDFLALINTSGPKHPRPATLGPSKKAQP
jgi:outer membrane protein OmpA-like peptidoglycan-associated protein